MRVSRETGIKLPQFCLKTAEDILKTPAVLRQNCGSFYFAYLHNDNVFNENLC